MSEGPVRHLSTAADAVRAFNHASHAPAVDWGFPADAYSALGSLSQLVERLPQALQQVTLPVTHTHEHGRVLIDGGDPDEAVARLLALQQNAVAKAEELRLLVRQMYAATNQMGLDTRGLPEDEDGS